MIADAMKANTVSPVVRALDIGWGYTKYSYKDLATESIDYASFPSLAPRHAGISLASSLLGKRDTVVVKVDGIAYEVGPESADLESGDSARNLNDQYIYTEQYRAVFYGALHYIDEDVIDVLAVGLPLNNMHAAEKLRAMMVGKHAINESRTIEVREALVLPQPLGGLHYCMAECERIEGLEFMADEVNLIVDPGFLTFDFLLAKGNRVIENRSGAHSGGVSKILRLIADSISAKHGIHYENLGAIDRNLPRRKMKINGVVEDLEPHIRAVKPALENSVNYMKNIVGDGNDIDNIILLGGGAQHYLRTISSFYPKHKITVVPAGQMANVRGFQLAADALKGAKA